MVSNKQTETITKKDFLAYLKVQRSGATNMFDTPVVKRLSGLSKDKILDIMKHYSKYNERWNPDELLKMIEVSKLLKVHPNTLRQWDAKGILKAIRFGQRQDRRYRKKDIEKLMERREA